MGTAIKHPVQDRVKPSFVIFDIRPLWRSSLSVRASECPDVKNYKWRLLNPVGTGCFTAVPIWQQWASKEPIVAISNCVACWCLVMLISWEWCCRAMMSYVIKSRAHYSTDWRVLIQVLTSQPLQPPGITHLNRLTCIIIHWRMSVMCFL